ncbi:toxin-antitoxin system HicB family antitoxin [Stomatobaculum longum]
MIFMMPLIPIWNIARQKERNLSSLLFKGSFNIRLSPALHKKLFLYATAHQMSINQYIEDTLEASPASKLVL